MTLRRSDYDQLPAMARALRDQIAERKRADHVHNVIVVCSWRPWRGYKIHEECVSCGKTLAQPGHWWRRSNMMKRYRTLQAKIAAECQRRITTLSDD